MFTSFASVWLLLALPFVSSLVIASVPRLLKLSVRHNRITLTVGFVGVGCLSAGLLGTVPCPYALPVMILGGFVSGFAMFQARPSADGQGDDRRRHDPPSDEDPPPDPVPPEPLDWERFDRMRAGWERTPVASR